MAEVWLVSTVDLVKVTTHLEKELWDKFKELQGPDNKPNASYHLREAMRLYLKVLESENSPEIFEELRSETR